MNTTKVIRVQPVNPLSVTLRKTESKSGVRLDTGMSEGGEHMGGKQPKGGAMLGYGWQRVDEAYYLSWEPVLRGALESCSGTRGKRVM